MVRSLYEHDCELTALRPCRQTGQQYNTEDGRKALRDIFALQIFDNLQILPRQNPKDESKIDVDIIVKERPMRTAEIECEWAIAPDDAGRPSIVNFVPGEPRERRIWECHPQLVT